MKKKKIEPGVFLVNKPSGVTSYSVVREFKKLFPGEKVGHTGTLDPLAEGLLIILVGRATKKQSRFLGLDKEYQVEVVFGAESNTYDREGKIKLGRSRRIELLEREAVAKAIKSFGKTYQQTVPPFSAVKREGRPLYRLARRGEEIKNLPRRRVMIKKAKLISFSSGERGSLENLPRAKINLKVSKGFYVRSFAHDLGKKLGTGGLVTGLRRIAIGSYSI